MHYSALHYWLKFQTNLTTFKWVTSKRPPKSSLKLYFLMISNYLFKFIRILWFIWDLGHLILKNCSETGFVFWKTHHWLNFQQTWVLFIGKTTKKLPKRDNFMDTASIQKHLEIYNLTTKNATLMKLTTIMYLHYTFNLAEDWGVTQRA